jgi:hypothetical protein
VNLTRKCKLGFTLNKFTVQRKSLQDKVISMDHEKSILATTLCMYDKSFMYSCLSALFFIRNSQTNKCLGSIPCPTPLPPKNKTKQKTQTTSKQKNPHQNRNGGDLKEMKTQTFSRP